LLADIQSLTKEVVDLILSAVCKTESESLKACYIDPETWEQTALNRPAWRHQTWKGVAKFETGLIARKKELRRKRKEREAKATFASH